MVIGAEVWKSAAKKKESRKAGWLGPGVGWFEKGGEKLAQKEVRTEKKKTINGSPGGIREQ